MTGGASKVEIAISRKTYPQQGGGVLAVLEDVRFTVREGEILCIVGPSGCGKTTLLNIVSGLESGYEGSVRIAGAVPAEARRIGYMFQSPRLIPWLTVRGNIELVMADSHDPGLVDAMLREMGLEGFADAWPAELSGGMQRRAALARAFATEPGLLLLDEPFLSLDAPAANRMRLLLLGIWRRRPTTVIFVTHDLREALFLADRILFMSPSPGRVVLELPVDLPRPREIDSAELEALRLDLLKQHPRILGGLTVTAEDGI